MTVQGELINREIERVRLSKDKLLKKQVNELSNALNIAAKQVKEEIYHFAELSVTTPLSSGQTLRLAQLSSLIENIDNLKSTLADGLSNFVVPHTEEVFKQGIYDSVVEFKNFKIPEYEKLKLLDIKALTAAVFSQIDKDAIDFLARFKLILLGDLSDQLITDIKTRITAGVISGNSTPEIVKDIGKIVKDPEKFKKAGKTVFKRTYDRLTLICRTEINRAHNVGRIKFYEKVGVKKVQWWASQTNSCPECLSRHGNIYLINEIDPPPKHPRCKCYVLSYIM